MKPGAVAASRAGGGTVAFSWEQEPGVSKQQNEAEGNKKLAAMARREEAVSRRTPAPAKNVPAPPAAGLPARPHRLRVPPPPGRPGTPAVLPAGKNKKKQSRARDDPFLAAYIACTGDAGRGCSKGKLLGWTGLGLGLGLGLRGGFGLSCKSSCGAVEECVVRLARMSELDDED